MATARKDKYREMVIRGKYQRLYTYLCAHQAKVTLPINTKTLNH